jgi:hypothetical protein
LAASGKYPFMFFSWVYVASLVVSSLIIYVKLKGHRFLTFCLFGSSFFFVLPHLFIAPAAEYRYLYYSYFAAVLTAFVLVVQSIERLSSIRYFKARSS